MAIFRPNGEKPKVKISTRKATPEELAKHRSYVERSERLHDMQPELIQKYPDQHVALTENGAFVVADSMTELVAKIKELGENPGSAAALFLNTKPIRVIL